MNEKIKSYKKAMSCVINLLADYVDTSQKGIGKVLVQENPSKIATDLKAEYWIRHGGLKEDNVQAVLEQMLENTQRLHHPHYIGHQVAVPHLYAGLADLVHGTINNPGSIYEMGPAVAAIEGVVINFLLEKIGWFEAESLTEFDRSASSGGGVLTHGGSLANLTALATARSHIAPEAW